MSGERRSMLQNIKFAGQFLSLPNIIVINVSY